MKNSKLVAEAKLDPNRIYPRPTDVLRDRRLDDAGRLEILVAWQDKGDATEALAPMGPNELRQALREVKQRLSPQANIVSC